MRIIGGERRGRRLAEWHGAGIRPLRDRVRTSLFDALGDLVLGARFLDLFAGTGAVGLEALSRGARCATFVDASAQAVRLIRENLRRLDYEDRALVLHADALVTIRELARRGRTFDLVYVGAPYGTSLAGRALGALGQWAPLSPGAVVAGETFHKESLVDGYGALRHFATRDYGETRLSFYRFQPNTASADFAPSGEPD